MSRSRCEGRLDRSADGGFTLLEVLAAVAILGMLFTLLAGVVATGLRTEGANLRRLRASLVADDVVSDLEAQMLAGVYPEASSREYELEDSEIPFTIQVDVGNLEDVEGSGGEADMVGFLAEKVPDLTPLLRVIQVRVSWPEGEDEESVHRETYLFDQSQWAASLPNAETPQEIPADLPEGESE